MNYSFIKLNYEQAYALMHTITKTSRIYVVIHFIRLDCKPKASFKRYTAKDCTFDLRIRRLWVRIPWHPYHREIISSVSRKSPSRQVYLEMEN
jgi:hypothetical protein